MSYILSALRKAEKDRNVEVSSTTENFLLEPEVETRPKTVTPSRWIILVLSLSLVICIGYLLMDSGALVDSGGLGLSPVEPVEPRREPIAYQPRIINTEGRATLKKIEPENDKTVAPDIATAPEPETGNSARPPMPSLNITGYIYFDAEPARSKLFVDGIVYRLNSRLGQGLILTGFDKEFVTVSYYGEQSRISTR